MKILTSVFCLVFWMMSGPLAYAFEINQYLHSPLRNKSLPEKTLSKKSGKSKPVIYFIHDIHAQSDAQRSIGSLIKEFQSKSDIGFIGLEGYEGTVSVEPLRHFPEPIVLKAVADFFLEKNKISGPVHAALLADKKFPPLIGIEESQIYQEHVNAYHQAAPFARSLIDSLADSKRKSISFEKSVLNPALFSFHENVCAFSSGAASLAEHLNRIQDSLGTLPEPLRLYRQILSIENKISLKKVESEKPVFLTQLAKKIAAQEQSELVVLSKALREGKISNTDFFGHIENLANRQKIDLSLFPHLSRYFEYVRLLGLIDTARMPENISLAEKNVYARLIRTAEEKKVLEQSRFRELSIKLVRLALTPFEWAEYRKLKSAGFSIAPPELALYEKFYEVALVRNGTLASNIEKTIKATHSNSGIVVAGGFHFEEIRKALEEKGYSIISVIPSFSAARAANTPSDYLKDISGRRSVLEKIMAGSVWTLAPPPSQAMGALPGALLAAQGAANPKGPLGQVSPKALIQLFGIRGKATTTHPGRGEGEVNITMPQGAVVTRVKVEGTLHDSDLKVISARWKWHSAIGLRDVFHGFQNHSRFMFQYLWRFPARIVVASLFLWKKPLYRRMALGVPLGGALFICGCAAPEHPNRIMPVEIPSQFYNASESQGEFKQGWLKTFNDPQLEELINEAVNNNVGLKIIDSIAIAKALADQASAGLFPEIGTNLNSLNSNSFTGNSKIDSSVGAAIGTNWEVDVWGRLSSLVRSAEAQVIVAKYRFEEARQGLAVEVARSYFLITAAKMQQVALSKQIYDLESLVKLAIARREAGVGEKVDEPLAKSELAVVKVRLERIKFNQDKAARALEVLLGRYPSDLISTPAHYSPLPHPMPVGVPSELLQRRAAIQAAWWGIESQFHQAESAYEARFPSLFISGQANASKIISQLDGIEFPATYAWSVGANILAPLLDWGKRAATQDFATELEKTAVQVWIAAVLGAFQDAENALAEGHSLERQEVMQQEAITEKKLAISIEIVKYENGRGSIQQIIQLRRELSDLEIGLIDIQNSRMGNRAVTQFVLGGTYDVPAEPASPTGGSWFANQTYVAWAWLETPFVFALVFAEQILSSYFSFGADMQFVNSLAWFAAPVIFYGSHFFRNRPALKSEAVINLTAYKLAISAVGFLLSQGHFPIDTVLIVTGVLTYFVTMMHKSIQDRIGREQIISANKIPVKYGPTLKRAQRGELVEFRKIQSALQVAAVNDRRKNTLVVEPSSLDKSMIRVVVVDSGFNGDMAAYVREALGTLNKNQKILFLSDSPVLQGKIQQLVKGRMNVSVDSAPSIFEYDETVSGLSLSHLEAYMEAQGYFSSHPLVQIMTRADLALLQEGLSVDSNLRKAIFLLLTKELAAVPFMFESLSEIGALAKIIAQQA